MKEFPIIRVRKGKIRRKDKIWKRREVINIIEELCKEYKGIYVIDLDGFRKNSPNLDLYKKVDCELWIDSYPRYTEDVMDLVIVGAEKITIRNMDDEKLQEIKEMCEKDIFLLYDDVNLAIKNVKKFGFKGIILDENQSCKESLETWKIYLNEEIIRRIR